jgi:type IV secretory pathway VirB2 component (pilin)
VQMIQRYTGDTQIIIIIIIIIIMETDKIFNWGRIYIYVTLILEIMYGERLFREIFKF